MGAIGTPEMTEDTNETTPTPTSIEPSQEPIGTLADAAADGVETPAQTKAELAQDFTADQMKKVESMIGQALDGAHRKWDDKREADLKAKGYQNPDQIQEIVAREVELAEVKATAKLNIHNWLQEEGIAANSDEGKQIFAEYKDGLESGRYTNKMLLDKKGVIYLVHAAGLAPQQSEATSSYDTSVPQLFIPTTEEGAPKNKQEMKRRVAENAQKVLEQHSKRNRRT
jgi:hypothetical protein